MLRELWDNRAAHRRHLEELHSANFMPKCLANRGLLAQFLAEHFPGHVSYPPGAVDLPYVEGAHASH
jgi:hypothetical protein